MQMGDREHIFLTRQVHVVFEPFGQSEHKRALPLHLVTRPAPCSQPRLQAGQCSCAVNAIESQCASDQPCATALISSAAAVAVHALFGGPVPKKPLLFTGVRVKFVLVNHAGKC